LANPLLEIRDLGVAYGDVRALWAVSLQVEAGTVVAIVGANGAGKSTLLRAISGIVRPSGGEILFSGVPLVGRGPDVVARMGIAHVPEGRGLFRQMTVRENLELGAFQRQARRHMKDSLDNAYSLFPRLKERVNQKAGSLSGGEQQMLAIARATMSSPSLLMLDEPSLGLSPLVVQSMFELIGTLHRAGVTILLVEQNIHQALKIADYAVVLNTGSVVMQGTGATLLADPEIQKAYMGMLE
jgi:branched-chain amino acid transport system ATP-binding protein